VFFPGYVCSNPWEARLPVSFRTVGDPRIGTVSNARTEDITFDVVELNYPYNAILRRGTLNAFEAATHSAYLCMKMPGTNGIITIFGSQDDAQRAENNWSPRDRKVNNIEVEEDQKQQKCNEQPQQEAIKEKTKPVDKPKQVIFDEDFPDQKVLIGSQLEGQEEQNLVKFLEKNKDIFAWTAKDQCGVSRSIIEHSLNVDPTVKPMKQKLRKMFEDRAVGAKAEVNRLLEARVIRPIDYPEWQTNVVMVRKANGKWRMCIDFMELNKACPKDEFPLRG